ncbi:rRNA pseudouridine synthase [Synechococcus moorigangaii CMS01]|nr:rRNA pseudouridine synthase [Synechococcus moorigangaii CMS01]
MAERVQKILAHWGIASRRGAEKLILAGRVTCNGKPVQLGDQADPKGDRLCVDGKPIKATERPRHYYYLIHKPKGVVSTCADPKGRPTVLDLLPKTLQQGKGIHPIGRLDVQSTGALLLTNDGAFTLALTHPRYHIPKTYRVWLKGKISERLLDQWRQGILLDGRRTLPSQILVKTVTQDKTCVDIMLTEGRNRQIRRVADQLGFPVVKLHRLAIGNLHLGDLQRGQARPLTTAEVKQLRTQCRSISPFHSSAPVREYQA